jgi:hypothetical protein
MWQHSQQISVAYLRNQITSREVMKQTVDDSNYSWNRNGYFYNPFEDINHFQYLST